MKNYKKILKIIGLIIFFLTVLYFSVGIGQFYRVKKETAPIRELAEEIKRIEKEYEELIMKDTYGGKTPKETLELFISAVEKEDFELASKYFVVDKQEEWRKELISIKKVNQLNNFLQPIIIENNALKMTESLWETKINYVVGDSILLEFTKYPTNIWKIKDI